LKLPLGTLLGRVIVNGRNCGQLVMDPSEWKELILTYILGARRALGNVEVKFLNGLGWRDL